jgi:hypothetical protein
VDYEKKDSSEVKTHEEILRLLKDVESLEEKVKNPDVFTEEEIKPEIVFQEVEQPGHIPDFIDEQVQPREPFEEIPQKKIKKFRQPLIKKQEKMEGPSREKKPWLSFLKKNIKNVQVLEPSSELEPKPQEGTIPRSTFILQLDTSGNLVGFPIKKQKQENQKKGWLFSRRKPQEGGTTLSEEETAKGIKGKLKGIVSKLGRRKSSEGESSGGMVGKITGIFRRKSKE